jgi:hypothetical protein
MPEPRVGPVQPTQDGQGKFAGIGFVVYGDDGRPAATFGFLNDAARTSGASGLHSPPYIRTLLNFA